MVVFLWEGKNPCLFPQYSGVYHWMYPYQPTWAPYGKSLYYVGIYEVIILIRSPAKYHGAHIGLHPSLSFEKKKTQKYRRFLVQMSHLKFVKLAF